MRPHKYKKNLSDIEIVEKLSKAMDLAREGYSLQLCLRLSGLPAYGHRSKIVGHPKYAEFYQLHNSIRPGRYQFKGKRVSALGITEHSSVPPTLMRGVHPLQDPSKR